MNTLNKIRELKSEISRGFEFRVDSESVLFVNPDLYNQILIHARVLGLASIVVLDNTGGPKWLNLDDQLVDRLIETYNSKSLELFHLHAEFKNDQETKN